MPASRNSAPTTLIASGAEPSSEGAVALDLAHRGEDTVGGLGVLDLLGGCAAVRLDDVVRVEGILRHAPIVGGQFRRRDGVRPLGPGRSA